jgi:anti-sigma regulatory factor (Ser/Thr protein kinase)
MTDPELTSLPTWLAARRTGAGLEPPVDVVLCVPPGDLARRLDRMGAGRFLRAFPSTSEARAAVLGRQIVTDRLLRRFPARPGTLAEARRLVTGACTAWGTPELGGNATLVISELAANAVEHAASDFVVLIARRPDGVHIAVCDDDPRMPRMPAHADGPLHLRGRGLRLIETLSSTWGAMPTATGKVVWATLRRP